MNNIFSKLYNHIKETRKKVKNINKIIQEVHISEIKPGDIVIHDNVERTVCPKDIKYNVFTGWSLFGDCYHCGHKHVKKVIYKNK